jgi:hypothetical protein
MPGLLHKLRKPPAHATCLFRLDSDQLGEILADTKVHLHRWDGPRLWSTPPSVLRGVLFYLDGDATDGRLD